jgi:hypothetical protein
VDDRIIELLYRNLQEVFGEGDAARRRVAIETSIPKTACYGAVGELVGIDGGVVSGVINLESSGVEASDWRPRHDERYHEA